GALVTVAVNGGSATTTTDVSGNWSAQFALPEGVYSADISAESSGVAASHIAIHFTVDTTPPTVPVLTAVDCAASLVSGMCVLPESRVTLSWTSDGTSYRVAKNGVPLDATTLSEETEQLSDGATTTFAVVAYDAAGNAATSTAIDIVQLSKSVVINEISWAGDTNPAHQWIELKNLSSYAIDLSRVSVSRSGGDPIQLSGTLPGYVAGRREHIAVVEPVAVTGTDRGGGPVLIILFPALSTSGEKLSLIWNTVPIDSTPEVGTCNGWCAGSLSIQIGSNVSGINNTYSTRSMERADNAPDGLLASSWHSTDGYGEWLGNSSALPWGTPGTDNSQGWPDAGVACDSSGPIEPNHTLHSTSGCVILTQFITGGNFGAGRYVATYRGDVGNSTGAGSFEGVRLASGGSVDLTGAHAGDHYFFAAFENRIWANDAPAFQAFFTDGSQPAPHGNYLVVPFTYAP
ncbi:MAG: hypothetical protein JWM46_453, partial [Candidatus Kaiserbacteria bacterium]|nr:hypothetical protein [Candidatus Kaiserbacteria bacterium]